MRKIPKSRVGELLMDPPLNLGFIIDGIEADYALKENMELGMTLRVLRYFEQGSENV